MASEDGPLPYWLVNVPRDQWPSSCPDFLVNCNAKDRGILSTPDAAYHRHTWAEVKEIIRTNRIDLFQRVPSDLRRYLAYTAHLRATHGSILTFVLRERLQWTDLTPRSPVAFADPDDIKILHNDWPYGIDPAIVHLVVWTRFALADDPATGDLTARARAAVDAFVTKTFCGASVSPENVIWFKNWRSLKSVHAVEHFHVMLYDPDPRFVEDITGGDVPLSQKVMR
ncbi:MAG: hypothetical protein M1833_006445 [Piccolia ochrophora]|nr:MAG: hypothetical protein M1833_006445 [Piccolia ochrophora]